MDTICVRLPCKPEADETFSLLTKDFLNEISESGAALCCGAVTPETLIRRLPLVYIATKVDRQSVQVVPALSLEAY